MRKEKLCQLRDWIKRQSVNDINSIEQEFLQQLLEMDKKEVEQFTDFLLREVLIRQRYKFLCDECGASCIEYEKRIIKGNCECGECGKIFGLEDIKRIGHVVYEICYEDFLEYDVDNIKEEEDCGSRVISLNEIKANWEERNIMEKKKIFLGSSTEAKNTMYDIAGLIGKEDGFETITWDSTRYGIFVAGDFTLESLIDVAEKVDGAVFIFNADDETWYRNEKNVKTTRDNVLFEYGLFIGKLDQKKVTFACKNKPHIATDLMGLNYLDADVDESVLRNNIRHWLTRI